MSDETHLYRHFDKDGTLLYVGISLNAIARLSQHLESDWSRYIARVEIETFQTRRAALDAERAAIKTECPVFNKVHNGGRREYAGYVPPVMATKEIAKDVYKPYKPPKEDGDEWLSMADVNRPPMRYSGVVHKVPPKLQQVAFLQDGRVRGGRYFWRKSDLDSACGRKSTTEANRVKRGVASLKKDMFTPDEWKLISMAAAA